MDYVNFSVRMPLDLAKRLEAEAKKLERSRNKTIEIVLKKALGKEGGPESNQPAQQ